MDALDGSKGERPFANSSELTNYLQSSISGSKEYEAVVFPAPLHPYIMYSLGIICIQLMCLFFSFGNSVAEEGEISKTWVVREYFSECVCDFVGCDDVLLFS